MDLPAFMDRFVVLRNVLLPVTALTALLLVCVRPQLAWRCLGVWATALGLVLFLPLRVASYTPSSFDDNAGGIGILVEWTCFSAVVGAAHAVFFALLVGAAGGRHSSPAPESSSEGPRAAPGIDFARLPKYPGSR